VTVLLTSYKESIQVVTRINFKYNFIKMHSIIAEDAVRLKYTISSSAVTIALLEANESSSVGLLITFILKINFQKICNNRTQDSSASTYTLTDDSNSIVSVEDAAEDKSSGAGLSGVRRLKT
jgi:hypothetical protein